MSTVDMMMQQKIVESSCISLYNKLKFEDI